MTKIHVLPMKELIQPELLVNADVVVYDVLLATSSILFLLNKNYRPIIAVENAQEAMRLKEQKYREALLIGEENGDPIESFMYPDPEIFDSVSSSQMSIFCTTNGTRAIQAAKHAKNLWVGSISNNNVLASHLKTEGAKSIVLIAAGNVGRMSLEDMLGAGHFIDHYKQLGTVELTDSARIAFGLYQQTKDEEGWTLFNSETHRLLTDKGFKGATRYVLDHINQLDIVAKYDKSIGTIDIVSRKVR
ncbi:2-phosphosulfolactate phosphatase [Chryseomicrobium aureum]|uniref:2-phosphosulfolactate phosphatase n=1 Tax=Chryseomicrobium aureum TaxID=1441723 RepID=UPI00195ACFFD|nr:2-phosphosulfolactate phosphatase [Chryseomicrobium aureum]MBM7707168.1 2-phosphosulfolactate phosphatase [Chryseomicrobium aureum]